MKPVVIFSQINYVVLGPGYKCCVQMGFFWPNMWIPPYHKHKLVWTIGDLCSLDLDLGSKVFFKLNIGDIGPGQQ